ncbi:MAG: Fpg/Nei family DNA glycosylase [Chloroflexi bacterium]|nr:Fpg/Nei family DNA glycosylase [Chloroflexota bacterium]
MRASLPEAPDLQVIREFLEPRLAGRKIVSAREVRPVVLRNLVGVPFAEDPPGRIVQRIWREGKLLFLSLSGDRLVVINPMLAGGLRYCPSGERIAASTYVVLGFDNGHDLRYLDPKRMGMVYYAPADRARDVPRVGDQGPDVLDQPQSYEAFVERLRGYRGEIKGVLTRGGAVSGIGNAYADEILFDARIFPFKKRTALSVDELRRLHTSVYEVPRQAVKVLRARVGSNIHIKLRDFLKVHGRGGEGCPRCGHPISAITANQRETNFCRSCQPGLLVRN